MARLRFRDYFCAFGVILQRRDFVRLIAAEKVGQSLFLGRRRGDGRWSLARSGGWNWSWNGGWSRGGGGCRERGTIHLVLELLEALGDLFLSFLALDGFGCGLFDLFGLLLLQFRGLFFLSLGCRSGGGGNAGGGGSRGNSGGDWSGLRTFSLAQGFQFSIVFGRSGRGHSRQCDRRRRRCGRGRHNSGRHGHRRSRDGGSGLCAFSLAQGFQSASVVVRGGSGNLGYSGRNRNRRDNWGGGSNRDGRGRRRGGRSGGSRSRGSRFFLGFCGASILGSNFPGLFGLLERGLSLFALLLVAKSGFFLDALLFGAESGLGGQALVLGATRGLFRLAPFLDAKRGLCLFTLLRGTEISLSLLKLFLGLGIALRRLLFYIGTNLGIGLTGSWFAIIPGSGFQSGITHGVETISLPLGSQGFLFLAGLILFGLVQLRAMQRSQRAGVVGRRSGGHGDRRRRNSGDREWRRGNRGDRGRRDGRRLRKFGLAQGFQSTSVIVRSAGGRGRSRGGSNSDGRGHWRGRSSCDGRGHWGRWDGSGLCMFGLAQSFQRTSVIVRRTGRSSGNGRGHGCGRNSSDGRGHRGGRSGRGGRGLWLFGLAQGFQSARVVVWRTGRHGCRRRGCNRDRRGHRCGRGRSRLSGLFRFFGLLFRFRRLLDRLGAFGLAQGLKGSGLIVWTVRDGLALGCRTQANSDTTCQDGELSVSHACFLEQPGKEINLISLANCASHARAKG
jgi:hypothetical protein